MSEFRKLQALPPNRLDSRALEELEAILLQDFAPCDDAFEVTAEVGDKRVVARSVGELLSRLGGAEPQSVRLRALDWRETNITRGATVEAYPLWAQCQVHGLDEAWFRGKLHQIDEFFRRNRPWYGLARPLLPFAIGGVVATSPRL
ncbi:hypothetical protein GCM10007167_24140 [Vulcaniibacterium thermophilum]|uniref:Uncharacterized protein n=1 Tax=Vulcaniibacterium thermophilum TaxID=1169913 RepID=A0A919DGP1_9GAMM|nr:hypothetical protein GCM10007167_24140 [Vulcaniibacterium thermophilum]